MVLSKKKVTAANIYPFAVCSIIPICRYLFCLFRYQVHRCDGFRDGLRYSNFIGNNIVSN
ncbi:hypothetical protein HMPREF1988_01237 [Porphyromonas gingivalis F0185]|nr:hypothetical protein HMPREF1988_01237 [Porphyromonas gingivalis F0185]